MKQSKELNTVRHTTELDPELLSNVRNSIIVIRGKPVIADADVANLYGVETKRINEAVRNNPKKPLLCGRNFRPQNSLPKAGHFPKSLQKKDCICWPRS